MAENRFFEWAGKQADWVRDALRRHVQSSNFDLADEDKSAILARVHQTAGTEQDEQHTCEPIGDDHTSFESSETVPRGLLASLGPVQNLARIASGQKLSFALNGITLIYGDNATGKSGYCRITKKVCRSQTAEDLLSDVFVPGAKPPAEVLIRYLADGESEPTEETWKDGAPPPKAIRGMMVFDSRNARFYIDKQNRVEFLPAPIQLLETHAAHCKEMGRAFAAEKAELDKRLKVLLPGGFTPGGEVANLLTKLVPKSSTLPTAEVIRKHADWTEADGAELQELEKALAQDPAALGARDERSQSALKGYLDLLPAIETGLSQGTADDLKTKSDEAKIASSAAALAAADAFTSEPLPGVGEDAWRRMYDHAKAFVVSTGARTDIPVEEGEPCALCQQPLSGEASARLKRFQAFVACEATSKAEEAKAALAAALAALDAISIPTKASVLQALGEYRAGGAAPSALGETVASYFEAAIARRDALKLAGASGSFDTLSGLPGSVSEALKAETGVLAKTAVEYRDQAKLDTTRAQSIRRQSELKDREKLSEVLDTVLTRRTDLERYVQLTECERVVNTQQLSTFITSYRRELFTEKLATRIRAEIDNLDLGHIPFAVTDQSRDGTSQFKVGLKTSRPVENDKILSEGEQRALALACFLAEAMGDDAKNGLVIDDPVSSLDHLRIRRVGKRLVEVAATGHQIIIFTHNLLFYNEVLQAAAAADPQVPVARRVISKSNVGGFGLVSEEAEPWTARKITTRIADLRARRTDLEARFTDFDTDEYRRAAKDYYTDLRETWERLVEELLLGEVVERYASEVKTQSLKLVEVDDDDYKTVFFAMKRVSERSGHDMPAGKQIPIPTPQDMQGDLDEIDNYRAGIAKRRKLTQDRRKALEGPPAPIVA